MHAQCSLADFSRRLTQETICNEFQCVPRSIPHPRKRTSFPAPAKSDVIGPGVRTRLQRIRMLSASQSLKHLSNTILGSDLIIRIPCSTSGLES